MTYTNPYSDTTYWREVNRELREDQRCSECEGFENPVRQDEPACECAATNERDER